MASPSRKRATKRRRSSITELAFHGIHTFRPKKAKSVTHVSGTECHLCLGPPQKRASLRVGPKTNIKRGVEGEPIEKVGFRQTSEASSSKSLELDDVSNPPCSACDLLSIADFRVRSSQDIKCDLEIAVVIRRVDDRKIELNDQLVQRRDGNPCRIEPPVAVQPAPEWANASTLQAIILREHLVAAVHSLNNVRLKMQIIQQVVSATAI
jgi:hypothetical protein